MRVQILRGARSIPSPRRNWKIIDHHQSSRFLPMAPTLMTPMNNFLKLYMVLTQWNTWYLTCQSWKFQWHTMRSSWCARWILVLRYSLSKANWHSLRIRHNIWSLQSLPLSLSLLLLSQHYTFTCCPSMSKITSLASQRTNYLTMKALQERRRD